jgi:hypothetical protein
MSERLKETLGMLEKQGVEVREAPTYETTEEGEIVGTRGGAVVPFVPKQVATSIPESESSDIRDDYVTSRNITHTLIDMAGQALEGALSVAIETQHPKAFTIFNELATTMRGLSKDLLEMQKIYKEITAEKAARKAAEEQAKTVNNNNLNITTNASLAEVLKMMKEGKIPMPGPTTIDAQTGEVTPAAAEVIDVV